jgi:hypothetical protein
MNAQQAFEKINQVGAVYFANDNYLPHTGAIVRHVTMKEFLTDALIEAQECEDEGIVEDLLEIPLCDLLGMSGIAHGMLPTGEIYDPDYIANVLAKGAPAEFWYIAAQDPDVPEGAEIVGDPDQCWSTLYHVKG